MNSALASEVLQYFKELKYKDCNFLVFMCYTVYRCYGRMLRRYQHQHNCKQRGGQCCSYDNAGLGMLHYLCTIDRCQATYVIRIINECS